MFFCLNFATSVAPQALPYVGLRLRLPPLQSLPVCFVHRDAGHPLLSSRFGRVSLTDRSRQPRVEESPDWRPLLSLVSGPNELAGDAAAALW